MNYKYPFFILSLLLSCAPLSATVDTIRSALRHETINELSPLITPEDRENIVEIVEQLATNPDSDVILYLYSRGCGICQRETQILAERFPQISIIRINVEQFPEVATAYEYDANPSYAFYRKGVLIHRMRGFMHNPGFTNLVRDLYPEEVQETQSEAQN